MTAPPRRNTAHTLQVSWSGDRLLLVAGRPDVPLGQKDIRLTLAAAEELRVPLPIANLLRDRFLTLLAYGGDKLDWSAIGQLAANDAGETR